MKVKSLEIPELKLIAQEVHEDGRGYFSEVSRSAALSEALGQKIEFVQTNLSASREGVLRGLHYQLPCAQGKLVRCLNGEIFDAAVDLRLSSPTFGKSVCVTLSAANALELWIPAGFAHGFAAVQGPALVLYQCTEIYHPECAQVLNYADKTLGIAWPNLGRELILAARDAQAPTLNELKSQGLLFK